MANRRLLFFFGIFCFVPAYSADFYVSTTGDDVAAGTLSDPWLTVQFGADQLNPGDVLHVLSGVYYEKISLNVSGTPGNPITISGTGGFAVLDGSQNTQQNAVIEIIDRSYISIVGMELRKNIMNDAQGILVEGNCQGIMIRENSVHDIHFSGDANDVATASTNAQAIIVFGSDAGSAIRDLVITGNDVFNCRLGYSEGIAVNGNVDGFEVAENTVHDLTNIGIVAIGHEETCSDPLLDQARNGRIHHNTVYRCHSPYASCAGVYIDGAKKIEVLSNSCSQNDYGIEIGCEHPGKSAETITVRNNILYANGSAGIAFGGYDYPGVSGKVTDSDVYNNTLYRNDTTDQGDGELVLTYFENCHFENNIFFTHDGLRAVTSVNVSPTTLNYNLYYTGSEDQSNLIETPGGNYTLQQLQQTGQETAGIYGDPGFTLLPLNDNSFVLTAATSIAVNAGNPSYAMLPGETDFYGNVRIQNGRVEIGAGEFEVLGLDELIAAELVLVPNPASSVIRIVSGTTFTRYVITDLSGQVVTSGNAGNNSIPVSDLPAGCYLIRCVGEGQAAQSRFIKN